VTHVKKTRKKRFDKLKKYFLKKLEGIKEKEIEPTTTIYQQYKDISHMKRRKLQDREKPTENAKQCLEKRSRLSMFNQKKSK
jgi:hypothetical protein